MYELIFVKGGWVMFPIAALSVYALSVVLFKTFQFTRDRVGRTHFIAPVMQRVRAGNYSEAGGLLENERGPVARMMRTALTLSTSPTLAHEHRNTEVTRAGTQEVRALESHMRGLEMVYTAAPLMGLLGTVLGMVKAFAKLAESGSRIDPTILAGGIWEALITTVGGLCVAIPALIAYYMLDSIIERVRAVMRDVTMQIFTITEILQQPAQEAAAPIAEAPVKPAPPPAFPPVYFVPGAQEPAEVAEEKVVSIAPAKPIEEMAEPASPKAEARAAKNTNTLHLLSPTYTKF
jgi:biopolymer transport protein ExbB